MKPPGETAHQFSSLLLEQADEIGVELDETSCSLLLLHLRCVLKTNQTFNLTTITNGAEAVRLHIVDSLVAAPDIFSAPRGRLADIGSGAGYPGIPLAVVTHRHTTLFESIGKKAAFLRSTVNEMGLESRIEIAAQRSEELSEEQRGRFTLVTARAVSSLPSLLELASPLLSIGGQLVAYKGVLDSEERSRGVVAAERLGFKECGDRRVFLPVGGEERTIIRYEKIREPEISLPRRPGMAQRRPVA